MKVPFVDLKAQYISIKEEIDSAIQNVINETSFIGGTEVNSFEADFAKLYGAKYCISVANGTDSLYIIMKMLGIGPGDEVITASNSWISSSETITQTGAKPVFLDIDPAYYSMDENLLEKSINANTKAIIPVHLHGQMCEMDKIMQLSKKYNLFVIEDCAQAHFSEYKGTRAGLRGVAASFSFYPGKNLGAYGDAGCILTDDEVLSNKFRMFARHGALRKHDHVIEGINSRMDGLQAAILNAKLPYILKWTEQRIANAATYTERLKGVTELNLPEVRSSSKHSFHLYVIRTEKRNELASFLKEKGIETAIHYPTTLPNLAAYSYLGLSKEEFPIASAYQNQILSLPMYPELTTEMIDHVVESIKKFFNQ
jgi:dTDP-4-amino-4,6-dideoxygalactose transaminase